MAQGKRSAAGTDFSATASPVVTMPPTISPDDVIEVIFVTDTVHDSTGTPPGSWTKRGEGDRGATDTSISKFWLRAVGNEDGTTVTFTNIFAATETGRAVAIAWQDNLASGDPWSPAGANPAAGADGVNATAQDTPAATPGHADCLAIGYIGADPANNPATFTWDGGITQVIGTGTTPSGQNALLASLEVGIKQLTGTPSTSLGGDFAAAERPYLFTDFLRPAAAGGQSVNLTGVSSASSVGTMGFATGPVSVQLSGVPTASQIGSFGVNQTVYLTGKSSAALIGTMSFIGNQNVSIAGVPTASSIGTMTVGGQATGDTALLRRRRRMRQVGVPW